MYIFIYVPEQLGDRPAVSYAIKIQTIWNMWKLMNQNISMICFQFDCLQFSWRADCLLLFIPFTTCVLNINKYMIFVLYVMLIQDRYHPVSWQYIVLVIGFLFVLCMIIIWVIYHYHENKNKLSVILIFFFTNYFLYLLKFYDILIRACNNCYTYNVLNAN